MSVSTPWASGTAASTARKNKTSIIADTGTNLAALDKTKFSLLKCTADGDVYLKDHLYLCLEDGGTTDLGLVPDHTHGNTSPGDGGGLIYIQMFNPEDLDLLLIKPTDLIKANWNQVVTGTGSIEDSSFLGTSKMYIRLRPNGTSGSGATIKYTANVNVAFDNPSIFVAVGSFETADSLAFHAGVNADDVTAADSNTRKYQAEVCTATNNNWWLRTANDTSNTASDIGVAIETGDKSIKIVHDPWASTPYALMEINAANRFTKTTDIPVTGSNSTGNILKFSIKNNTAADRPYRFKGARLSYITNDSWGYG